MERSQYVGQARRLADVVRTSYHTYRYSELGTIWYFGFLWDGTKLREHSVANPFVDFISETFEQADESEIVRPEALIPKVSSTVGHYVGLSLANRDLIERIYRRALEEVSYEHTDEVLAIVSDRKLVEESMRNFVQAKREGVLEDKVDLFDFLLRYDLHRKAMLNERNLKGTYVPLTTRLVYRYGEEKIEDSVFSLARPEFTEEARILHYEAKPKIGDIGVPAEVAALHEKHVKSNDCSPRKPPVATKVKIPGPRRVRVSNSSMAIDWTAFLRDRQARRLTYQAFKPEEVLLARIEGALTERYLNIYRASNSERVLSEIDSYLETSTSDQEKEVLRRIRKKFEIIAGFDNFNIKHKMPVTIRRR